ncbi:MAG: class I adenylate-forming enzyme family protein [Pseudomonadota bacterium]
MLPRDYIARCAANFPDKTAYHDGDRSLSWQRIHERSDRLAAALQSLGFQPGEVAAILSHEHLEVYEHLYACYKTGLVRCGINWRYAPREMLHVIRDSDARVILVQANCVPLLEPILADIRADGRRLIGYGGEHGLELDYETLIAAAPAHPQLPALREDDLIALSYTSGTTGLPKGVMIGQGAMRDSMVYTVLGIGLRYEDVWFPPTASGWITFILGSFNLTNGMTVVLPNGDFDTARFLEFVGRYRVTSTIIVPLMMQRLLDEYDRGGYDLSSLRLVTYGSSPARPALIRRTMDTFGCELMQLYGITETTGGWVTFLHHDDHLRGLAERPELLTSCGRAGVHMELSIRDEQGRALPPGEQGEVWIRSSTNMLGYLNLSELTAQTLVDGWLKTHDLGRLDAEGYLYLTDRKNFLIISGAANVYPSVVETVLAEHPAIREVAVIGAPHPEWGEAVVATVSLREGTHVTGAELLEFCRPRLAKYEVPKHIEIVDDLPKGLTGKILKKNIQGWYKADPARLPWKPVD